MRQFLLAVAAIVVASASIPASTSARGGEFPFTGYVGVDRAEVASGPGRRYYTTDRLRRGTEVQVFEEDAAGWLAIRPPEGSFSWVPAEQVRVDDGEETGQVLAATPCWIGTNVERVEEHRTLVTLKPGEVVQVLGRRVVSDEDGPEQAWLKIAPPAGEFRYIHGRDLSREPTALNEPNPRKSAAYDELAHEEPRQFRAIGGVIALEDIGVLRNHLNDLTRADERQEIEPAQVRSSVGQGNSPAASSDGFVARKRKSGESEQPGQSSSGKATRSAGPTFSRPKLDPPERLADSRPSNNLAASTPGSHLPKAIPSDQVARQIEQLELDLSLMLSQDRSTWNLTALRGRAQELVEYGERPVDRGQARVVLDKIKQFEDAFGVEGFGPIASTTAPPLMAVESKTTGGASASDPRYDGQGWLKPVISRGKPAAPYALVDAEGKPLYFITPSPGMNLSNYVNKQVGVYGRRGYLESLKTPHVTAERVIDLERQWR